MVHLPFSVSRRKGCRFHYVQFKGENGKYLPAISTKQTTEAAAIEIAFKWLREGIPSRKNDINVDLLSRDVLREIKTTSGADFVYRELKRMRLLKTSVISQSKQDVDFTDFLYGFWDSQTSPYVKKRLRKNHGIHRNHTAGYRCIAERCWEPFFRGRFMGDITRQDIENFMDSLDGRKFSASWKN